MRRSLTIAAHARSTALGVLPQKSVERGSSYGYQVQWGASEERARFAVATLQHQRGRVELRQDGFETGGASATLSGAIVGVGGRLFATRPVQDAFALVRVPETRGVRVYSSNQLMGRTDRNGELVVPDVISYYGNSLAIEPTDLPMTLSSIRNSALVAPSLRAGSVALFRVKTMNPVVGRVIVNVGGSMVVPASRRSLHRQRSGHELTDRQRRRLLLRHARTGPCDARRPARTSDVHV